MQLKVWNTIKLERFLRKGEIRLNEKATSGESPVRNSKLTEQPISMQGHWACG